MNDPGDLAALGLDAADSMDAGWRGAPFAPAVEAEFLKAAAPATVHIMRAILTLTALLGIAEIWGAGLSGPAAVRIALIMELLVNLPTTLLAMIPLQRLARTTLREAVLMAAIIVRMVTTMTEGHAATLAYADRYVMAGGLTLFCTLLLVPLRLPQAARFVAIAFPIYVLATMLPFDAMSQSTWDILVFAALLMPIGLRVRWRIERSERRSFLFSARDRTRVQELARANDRLHRLSHTDSLTGIGNRRSFDRTLQRVIELGAGVCLLMIDADYFKRFNDSQGHPQGDECLRQLAHIMREHIRAPDHVSRYGGEEFAIILPGATAKQAIEVAERIRRAVEALMLPHQTRPDASQVVTVSIGVAVAAPNETNNQQKLITEADEALYAAKQSGRNCIRRFGISEMMLTS